MARRWHTVRLATLSFYEYLQINKSPLPAAHARLACPIVRLARESLRGGGR